MSLANPTRLRLGANGNLAGKNYRVIGRVVMSMTEDGENYYWNEFNLEAGSGGQATLVFEETERGGEWRLFTRFEPEQPLTAGDAAAKRVGDPVNLDGTEVCVTLVSQARVGFVEGRAPEGEKVGELSNYFNAETGSTMLVVSWIGEKVEYYQGETLARGTVQRAFGINESPTQSFLANRTLVASGSGPLASGVQFLAQQLVPILVLTLFGFIFITRFSSCDLARPVAAIKSFALPATRLQPGMSGVINGKTYRVAGHDLVQVAEVGLRFQRHEFQLVDDEGNSALLVCGLRPDGKEWGVFTPLQPSEPLTPQRAGSVRLGELLNVDGIIAPASELFSCQTRRADDSSLPGWSSGLTFYGFLGRTNQTLLLVRWNETGIAFHRGVLVTEKNVCAAFRPPAGK